jgi:hypothetical protein
MNKKFVSYKYNIFGDYKSKWRYGWSLELISSNLHLHSYVAYVYVETRMQQLGLVGELKYVSFYGVNGHDHVVNGSSLLHIACCWNFITLGNNYSCKIAMCEKV